jgi:hypothetical protein
VGALGPEEVLLIRCLGVAVARRDHHALDAQVHHLVEELAHPQRARPVEQGRVRGDPESAAERFLDALDRLVVHAVAAHRFVVLLAQAVEMHAEREVLRRGEEPASSFSFRRMALVQR